MEFKIDELFKSGNLLTGLGVTLGALVLVPVAIGMLRPLAKTAVKAGLLAYDQGAKAIDSMQTAASDLVSEARNELQHSTGQSVQSTPILDASGAPIRHEAPSH